jgi:hypothetical protein
MRNGLPASSMLVPGLLWKLSPSRYGADMQPAYIEFIVEFDTPKLTEILSKYLSDAEKHFYHMGVVPFRFSQIGEASFAISAQPDALPEVAEALVQSLKHFSKATIVLRPKLSPKSEYSIKIEYPVAPSTVIKILRRMRVSPDHKDSFEGPRVGHYAPSEWSPKLRYVTGEELVDSSTFPVSIYLSDAESHQQVEDAVVALLDSVGLEITVRGEPELGSWFLRMRAKLSGKVPPELARDAAATLAHAAESRLVTAQEAQITAMMMQNLGPVLGALQPTKDAAIRVGALLIVKVEWVVGVHQLTAKQQWYLDHHPELAGQPHNILSALALPQPDASQAPVVETSRDSPPEG